MMNNRLNRWTDRRIIGILIIVLSVLACSLPMLNSGSGSQSASTEDTQVNSDENTSSDTVPSQENASPDVDSEEPIEMEVLPPEPGSTLRWIDSSLLVYIPPSEFVMGHEGDDNPEHIVFLSGFWIYRTEVTNRMYLNCMAKGKCSPPAVDPAIPDLEDPEMADFPAVGVRWGQAAAYCESVGGYLPTEAQWEKTARGAEGYIYPWGNTEPTCELLNFDDCRGESSLVRDYPLGASPYEVLDMAGNVFEWVADWYQEDYYAESPVDNPMGPEFGKVRSVRGSTYRSEPDQIESSLRYFLEPEKYRIDLGFRCVVGNAEQFAPPCEVLAHPPADDLAGNPDEPPGGSAACVVPQPELSIVTYCEKGQRGNNISWTPADAEINYSIQEGAWCSMYDADTLACKGNYGALVNVKACKSCPPPKVELGVPGTCDPPYVFDDTTSLCKYSGPPVPGEVVCAPGYSLSGDDSCCEMQEGTPLDYPICPVGGVYEPTSHICWFTLPSTGDEKCVSDSVFFKWCPPEPGDVPQDPCNQYVTQGECERFKNVCHWDVNICVSN
jgi:formylglycine-generating enzyme required for sulfatase activity